MTILQRLNEKVDPSTSTNQALKFDNGTSIWHSIGVLLRLEPQLYH